jgi:hypothetical protein
MTTMKQFHWFWAWDDEKEEAWLREMAQKGWHFKSVSLPGNYVFEYGEPRNDVYRLDYFTSAKDKPNYLQLFIDAGWEYLGEMNSWQYFRKLAGVGELPEIFSDNESKSKKYRRILLILVAVLPMLINPLLFGLHDGDFFGTLSLIQFLLLMFYIYAVLRMLNRINQLKKKV